MVDKSDILMHLTLIHFVGDFIESISITEITPQILAYLRVLMRKVSDGDEEMYQSLEGMARNEEARPEVVDLLVKLNEG